MERRLLSSAILRLLKFCGTLTRDILFMATSRDSMSQESIVDQGNFRSAGFGLVKVRALLTRVILFMATSRDSIRQESIMDQVNVRSAELLRATRSSAVSCYFRSGYLV